MLNKQTAYEKWLGIKAHDQPPTHYRLLSLDVFESDADIISNAADSRMSYLRQFQTGDNAQVAIEILNEMAKARVTLLNAEKKSAYDVQLRQRIAAQGAGQATAAGSTRPAQSSTMPGQVVAPSGGPLLAASRKPAPLPVASPLPTALQSPAFGPFESEFLSKKLTSPGGHKKKINPLVWIAPLLGLGVLIVAIAVLNFSSGSQDAPPANRVNAIEQSHGVLADSVVIWNTHNGNGRDRGTATCNVLLKLDGKTVWHKDDVHLKWNDTVDPKEIVNLPQIRFDALRIEVTQFVSNGGGISEIEVYSAGKNIAQQLPVTASATYLDPKGEFDFDASKVTDGITQSSKMGVGYWLLPNLTLGWIEIDFTGKQVIETALQAGKTELPLRQWVDVLRLLDTKKNAVKGNWYRKGTDIICDPEACGRIEWPLLVEGSYDLAVEFTRDSGSGDADTFFPVGSHQSMVVLSAEDEDLRLSGLALVDGHPVADSKNPTAIRTGAIENGRRYRLLVSVRVPDPDHASVDVTLDGKPYFTRWDGNPASLDIPPVWSLTHPARLGFGNYESHVTFHSAQLKLLSGKATADAPKQSDGAPIQDPWLVIFRSADPSIWGKNINEGPGRFALSLDKAPNDTTYLRMAISNHDPIIIPITKPQLGLRNVNGATVNWNGNYWNGWNAYHFGVFDKRLTVQKRGDIEIAFETNRGWGFGGRHAIGDMQGYSWQGEPIPYTVFEIALRSGQLGKDEAKFLLTPKDTQYEKRTFVGTFASGEKLFPGDEIVSANKQYLLGLQGDGNFVLYHLPHFEVVWASRTAGKGGVVVVNQDDGNIVMFNAADRAVWATDSITNSKSSLVLGEDGTLKVNDSEGRMRWQRR